MEEDIDGGIQVDGEDTLQLRGMACDEGSAMAPLLLTLISVEIYSIFTKIVFMYGTNNHNIYNDSILVRLYLIQLENVSCHLNEKF